MSNLKTSKKANTPETPILIADGEKNQNETSRQRVTLLLLHPFISFQGFHTLYLKLKSESKNTIRPFF